MGVDSKRRIDSLLRVNDILKYRESEKVSNRESERFTQERNNKNSENPTDESFDNISDEVNIKNENTLEQLIDNLSENVLAIKEYVGASKEEELKDLQEALNTNAYSKLNMRDAMQRYREENDDEIEVGEEYIPEAERIEYMNATYKRKDITDIKEEMDQHFDALEQYDSKISKMEKEIDMIFGEEDEEVLKKETLVNDLKVLNEKREVLRENLQELIEEYSEIVVEKGRIIKRMDSFLSNIVK